MEKVKILIADNHQVVRQGLRAVLEIEDGFELVGEATRGDEVIEKAKTFKPDIILMDIRMSDVDGGITATKEIKKLMPDIKVLIFSSYHTSREVAACMEAGVDGYLLKDTPSDEITKSIWTIKEGGSVLHPVVTKKMMDEFYDSSGSGTNHSRFVLTPREEEILNLMAKGAKNKDIAKVLFLAETTVKAHVGQILRKLDAEDRTQALLTAIKRGIVEVSEGEWS